MLEGRRVAFRCALKCFVYQSQIPLKKLFFRTKVQIYPETLKVISYFQV